MKRHYETHLYTYAVALTQGAAIRPENIIGIRAKAVKHHSEGAALCVEIDPLYFIKTGDYKPLPRP